MNSKERQEEICRAGICKHKHCDAISRLEYLEKLVREYIFVKTHLTEGQIKNDILVLINKGIKHEQDYYRKHYE